MIELDVLGRLELRRDGRPVRSVLSQPKRAALLLYLVLGRPRGFLRRDELLGVFWPDLPEDRARNALSQALHVLRGALGAEAIERRGQQEVRVAPVGLTCDALRFEAAADSERHEAALELYRGELLDGFHLTGAPAFERWLHAERERLRRRARTSALALAERAEGEGEFEAAVRWSRRALEIAPSDEEVVRHLMRGLDRCGNRAGALAAYRALAARLERRLGLEPSPETCQLAETIRNRVASTATRPSGEQASLSTSRSVGWFDGEPEPEPAPGRGEGVSGGTRSQGGRPLRGRRGALVGLGSGVVLAAVVGTLIGGWSPKGGESAEFAHRSIAVLPFEELGEAAAGILAVGLQDDLITRLSSIAGLDVVSRRAVLPYRGTDETASGIARDLDVQWVVEGAVQVSGDRIQVNVQLVDPRTETHAWADSYRGDFTAANLFDLQSRITKSIAQELDTRLTAGEEARVEAVPTESLEAYRHYLQGRALLDRRTESAIRQAVDYFRRAIERDSGFALAWSGLADGIGMLGFHHGVTLGDSVHGRLEAARRSVELGPDRAEAHASLANAVARRWDGPAALRGLRRAVELRPGYAQAHHWLAFYQNQLGRPGRALESALTAVELNPYVPTGRGTLATAHLANAESQKALVLVEEAPDWNLVKVVTLLHMGRSEKARAGLREGLRRDAYGEEHGGWNVWAARALLAVAHATTGDSVRARQLLARLEEAGADPFWIGLVHASLSEEEEAFAAFGRIEEWQLWPILHARYYWPDVLGPLRADPGYRELIRDINRQWGLRADGSLPSGDG